MSIGSKEKETYLDTQKSGQMSMKESNGSLRKIEDRYSKKRE